MKEAISIVIPVFNVKEYLPELLGIIAWTDIQNVECNFD